MLHCTNSACDRSAHLAQAAGPNCADPDGTAPNGNPTQRGKVAGGLSIRIDAKLGRHGAATEMVKQMLARMAKAAEALLAAFTADQARQALASFSLPPSVTGIIFPEPDPACR
ncbi:MAG: hypothetical protein R3D25_01510 [Geminicoccaceae bacterium]